MAAGLPLMKNVPMPLAKSVLIPLGLTASALASQKNFGIRYNSINSFKQRNRRYNENTKIQKMIF